MQKIIKNKIFLLIITLLTFNASMFAQDDPGLPTEQDPGAVPIDSYIPFVILAIVLLCYICYKKQIIKQTSSN